MQVNDTLGLGREWGVFCSQRIRLAPLCLTAKRAVAHQRCQRDAANAGRGIEKEMPSSLQAALKQARIHGSLSLCQNSVQIEHNISNDSPGSTFFGSDSGRQGS